MSEEDAEEEPTTSGPKEALPDGLVRSFDAAKIEVKAEDVVQADDALGIDDLAAQLKLLSS